MHTWFCYVCQISLEKIIATVEFSTRSYKGMCFLTTSTTECVLSFSYYLQCDEEQWNLSFVFIGISLIVGKSGLCEEVFLSLLWISCLGYIPHFSITCVIYCPAIARSSVHTGDPSSPNGVRIANIFSQVSSCCLTLSCIFHNVVLWLCCSQIYYLSFISSGFWVMDRNIFPTLIKKEFFLHCVFC
jgi:hypothetical protein